MSAVELYSIWERYAENRLVAALNHNPKHFLKKNNVVGVSRVSLGLARYIIRGGRGFSDFRSTDDLIKKAELWLGASANPFNSLRRSDDLQYLDCLAAVRNRIVHGSDASISAYRQKLRSVYGIAAAPGPDEFLHAKEDRGRGPAPGPGPPASRLRGLAIVVARSIDATGAEGLVKADYIDSQHPQEQNFRSGESL
jgi:hypothetical protein